MQYTQEVFDRKTGELVNVDVGDWITITELGQLFACDRRKTRVVLNEMGLLVFEGEGKNSRYRLCHWVVEKGWGKRLRRKRDKLPFDVVGPDARCWVEERWPASLQAVDSRTKTGLVAEAKAGLEAFKVSRNRMNMTVQEMVCWIAGWLDWHFSPLPDQRPRLTEQQIADILNVTQQLVGKYLAIRIHQISKWETFKKTELPRKVMPASLELDCL